ncbi:MAG: O-antigen ligase family protein [Sarcina sp.]
MKLQNLAKLELSNKYLIKAIIFCTIFIMPFLISKNNKPHYLMAKVYYLYIAGFLLLILLIKDNLKPIKTKFQTLQNFNFKYLLSIKFYKNSFKNKIELKMLFIFLLTYTACTLSSKYIGTALLGNPYRYEGLIIYYIYAFLFLAALKYISIDSKVIELSCICATLMAILTIFQLHDIDPLYKYFVTNPNNLAEFGTIGNRNFLSTYLLIFQPIPIYGYIVFKKNRHLIYSCLIFGGILSGQTRSVWLSFLIISIVALFFMLKKKLLRKRILILTLCFVGVFITINSSTKHMITLRSKTIVTELQTAKTSGKIESLGSGRGSIWLETLKVISKNPFMGFGPDTLNKRLNHYSSQVEYSNVDKAHNEYLEYFATGGIITLISYLILTISILIKLFKKNDDISKCLFLIILGYMIQAFFNISVLQVAPIYWITLGISLTYASKPTITEN